MGLIKHMTAPIRSIMRFPLFQLAVVVALILFLQAADPASAFGRIFAGLDKLVGGTVDMGAYEYQGPSSVISYAWLQQYGLPTDGSVDYADPDGDGMNNYQEFLAGTIPTNSASVLSVQINKPAQMPRGQQFSQMQQGMFLSWNTQPGLTYQVQTTTNFTSWSNLGTARFAAGTSDSIFVGGSSVGYYRVVLLR